MFKNIKKKHSVIIFILFIVALVIGIHTYSYYQTHGKISSRAIAGWVIIILLLIHRSVEVLKDLRVEKLVGDPLASAIHTEYVEHNIAPFPVEQKKKLATINSLFRRMKEKEISSDVFSRQENREFTHLVINHLGTLLITGVVVAVMAIYRQIIISFGIIGIGIAMFMGISIAAFFTSQLRKLFLLYSKRRESRFFRMYRNGVKSGEIEMIPDVIFFKNHILLGEITLVEISDQQFSNVKFIFIFLERFFLELTQQSAVNGIYEGEGNLFVFQPLSQELVKTAKKYLQKCDSLDKASEEMLTRYLEQII